MDVGKLAARVEADTANFERGMGKAANAAANASSKIREELKKLDPEKAFNKSIANKIEDLFKVGGLIGAATAAFGFINGIFENTKKEADALAGSIEKIEDAFKAAAKSAEAFGKAKMATAFGLNPEDTIGRGGAAFGAGNAAVDAAEKAVDVARKELAEFDKRIADRGLGDDLVAAGRRWLGKDDDARERRMLTSRLQEAAKRRNAVRGETGEVSARTLASLVFNIRGQLSLLQGVDLEADMKQMLQLRKSLRDGSETLGEMGAQPVLDLGREIDEAMRKNEEGRQKAKRDKQIDADIAASAALATEELAEQLKYRERMVDAAKFLADIDRGIATAGLTGARADIAAAEDRARATIDRLMEAANKADTVTEVQELMKRRDAIQGGLAKEIAKIEKADLQTQKEAIIEKFKASAISNIPSTGAAGAVVEGSSAAASALARFERQGAAQNYQKEQIKKLEEMKKQDAKILIAVDKVVEAVKAGSFTLARF